MEPSYIQSHGGKMLMETGGKKNGRKAIFTLCLSLVARRNAREEDEGEAPREKEEEKEKTTGRKLFPTESFASGKKKERKKQLWEDTISNRQKWIRSSRFVNHCSCVWCVVFMYLVLSCQVRLTVGDRGLCCCVCATSFRR